MYYFTPDRLADMDAAFRRARDHSLVDRETIADRIVRAASRGVTGIDDLFDAALSPTADAAVHRRADDVNIGRHISGQQQRLARLGQVDS